MGVLLEAESKGGFLNPIGYFFKTVLSSGGAFESFLLEGSCRISLSSGGGGGQISKEWNGPWLWNVTPY